MYFFSRVKVTIEKEFRIKALDLILKNNLSYINMNLLDSGNIVIEIYSKRKKDLTALFDDNQIKYVVGKDYGVLSLLESVKHRYGLAIGIAFLILMVYLSSNIVWKINIIGNEKYSDEEIIDILNQSGLSLGSYTSNIDYDRLHNKILMQTDKISWISVNLNGTVANVEIKETMEEEQNSEENTYSNIVASRDGYICSIEVINGEKVVSKGQIVKKGDLLISGVINSQSQGVRYEHANGTVKAYTNKHIEIKIPSVVEEKVYTGRVYEEKKLKLFSKYINFSLKNSKYSDFCDKIEKKKTIKFLGFDNLPIEKEISRFYEYRLETFTRTKQELVDLAFIELKNQMDFSLQNAELVSKTIKTDFDGTYFYVYCDLYCVEDIAQEVQFYVIK